MDPRFYCLIPARGGSQGVARKNLAQVGETSLLVRSIRAAVGAKRISKIFVSTDDSEIASTAGVSGVSVHWRSNFASTSSATATDVVKDFLSSRMVPADSEDIYLVYLQPTSPFRKSHHIDEAIDLMQEFGRSSLVSIRRGLDFREKEVSVTPEGSVFTLSNGPTSNRQELKTSFFPNGAIYIFSLRLFSELDDFPIDGSLAYEMDPISSIDIDTPEDLLIARAISDFTKL